MAEIGVMKKLTIGGSTYTIPEYDLPIASASTLGGVKIGTGLTINSTTGVLSATGLDFDEVDPVFTASAAYGITSSDISNWNSKTSNTGTVTSVRVQATSPVQSSTSTAQTSTLNTTISLADGYGDTKNPYGTKTANYVLAGPSSGSAAAPTFRKLVAADIPDLSSTYLTNSTLYEANLQWGGKDFSASYSPIDAAMIDTLGANRFAFLKATGLTIEYSTDGGSSWSDYGATDAQKVTLFSNGNYNFYLGKHTTSGSCTTSDQLRVTIDTSTAGIYTKLNKIVIYMTSYGATTQVLTEKALQNTPTTFTTHKDWTGITGWSGWNVLNISDLTTYGNAPTTQYGRVRFTFRQTAVNTSYSSAAILRIMGFGGVGWTVPSNMAKDGHLYSYDSSQNATFPAKVTANGGFSGNLTGTATGNLTSVQYDSTNAKLTYTKNGSNTDIVTVATLKSALGSMPASDVYSWAKASTKPSYTFSEIGSKPTTISGYGITDAYTKTQVDELISGVLHYKGTKASVANLPTSGNTTGDVWHITADGSEYAWDGSIWQELGTAVDLSSYALKTEIPTVPTNISAFTNDSGYITSYTDEKMKWTASTSSNTYYPLQSTSTATTSTANTLNSVSFYQYYNTAGGYRRFILGNTTAYTSSGGAYGTIRLYGTGATYYGDLNPGTIGSNSLTANRTWTLPDKTGTIALTSDIPTIPTNVSAFTNDAGYITDADIPEGASAYTGTPSAVSTTASTGTSNAFARGDHVHSITSSIITSALGYTPPTSDTNTWRTIQVDGTDILGSAITTNKLNLKAGTGISLSNSSGTVTITNTVSNTDTMLQVAAVTSGTTYYPIVGTGTTAATRQYDTTGFIYVGTNGTTSAVGSAQLTLGNSTASGTANNKQGIIRLYGTTTYYHQIQGYTGYPTANRTIYLPRYAGTMYLTCTSTTSAVGGATTAPVYVDNTGCIQAVTSIPYSLLTGTPTIPSVPTSTGSSTTGISIAAHSSTSIYGVQSTTTTASKASGSNSTAPSLTYTARSVGSASGWSAGSTNVTNHVLSFTAPTLTITSTACDDITAWSAGSASTWSFSDVTVPIKNTSSTTVVTSTGHTITDNGHTHTI